MDITSHEKERNKKMPTQRHKVTHNPIPIYIYTWGWVQGLLLCFIYRPGCSRRVRRSFVHGLREISLVPSIASYIPTL